MKYTKQLLLSPLNPIGSDPDARKISLKFYKNFWDAELLDIIRDDNRINLSGEGRMHDDGSKYPGNIGDTMFSPKGCWNKDKIFPPEQIIFSKPCKSLENDFCKKYKEDADDDYNQHLTDYKYRDSTITETQIATWFQYHCLANFAPIPSMLNQWRGWSDAVQEYPKHDWYDSLDEFMDFVKQGYNNKAGEKQVVFEKHRKYFGFFGSFENYCNLNFLPCKIARKMTLLETMQNFLSMRVDKLMASAE